MSALPGDHNATLFRFQVLDLNHHSGNFPLASGGDERKFDKIEITLRLFSEA